MLFKEAVHILFDHKESIESEVVKEAIDEIYSYYEKKANRKLDYSKYDAQKIIEQIKINIQAKPFFDFIQCPICKCSEAKSDYKKVFCTKKSCYKIYLNLRNNKIIPPVSQIKNA